MEYNRCDIKNVQKCLSSVPVPGISPIMERRGMFVSPKYDDVIKELFGNLRVLKYFLRDVLGIELERIRSIRFRSTFIRRRWRWQKLGILDIVLELNDDTKVSIELQVKQVKNWDKRQLFYLSKLYAEDLRRGEDYSRLKKCVGISILDFNRDDSPEYHRVYRLKDKNGKEYSDILELHVLELNKRLTGQGEVEEWIRFFNAESEEDLDMIRTKNPGIQEAIEELRRLSMDNPIRALYEAHQKKVRDQKARDEYVWDLGREEGHREGHKEGHRQGYEEGESYKLVEMVCKKLRKGKTAEEIAEELEEELAEIQAICVKAAAFVPRYDAEEVFKALFRDGKQERGRNL